MKKLIILLFAIAGCREAGQKQDSASLSPVEFQAGLSDEVVLIDVRTPDEFREKSIAGAQNMDIKSPDFESRLDSLDKSRTYFVYCAAGTRSDKAAELMRSKGFEKVITLEGGIKAWSEEGLPVN
jgi:rhodanese-related sulfurtransferase